MKRVNFCAWSTTLKVETIIVCILLIGLLVWMGYNCFGINQTVSIPNFLFGAIIIILILLTSWLLSPQYIESTEDSLIIHLIGFKYVIKKEDIVGIECYKQTTSTFRVFAIGGLFGNVGLFMNNNIGTFIAFVTDFSHSYIIRRNNKKSIVISVDDISILHT